MDKVRTFIAIPLSAELQKAVGRVQRQLVDALPDMRWVRPETIHLTLAFLGDIPQESLENVASSMLSIGELFAPFEAQVAGLGAFPSRVRPRVVWLGLEKCAPLLQMQAALTEIVAAVGLPVEDRPYTPHLTLGRCRSRRQLPEAGRIFERFEKMTVGTLKVDRVVLYESRLQPGGAAHLPRQTVILGNRPQGAG
jgi:2'-5' RNA ligase